MAKSAKRPSGLRRHRASRGPRNPLVDERQEYSTAELKRLFRLSDALIEGLAKAHLITVPSHGRVSFGFQDGLVLRLARALRAAGIPQKKLLTAIGKIQAALPPGSVLAVMARRAHRMEERGLSDWRPHDSEPEPQSETASDPTVASRGPRSLRERRELADSHYARGHGLEESDAAGARAAYLKALDLHEDHIEARINLGRLLHLEGELDEAEKVYRRARISSALLSFNLAVLLEDMNRDADAMSAYREALAQDPTLHDAHLNLSRLHERAHDPRAALRHLIAYRRLATV